MQEIQMKMKSKGYMAGGKTKGYKAGGKIKMVEKDGKKVPFFAADGQGQDGQRRQGSNNQRLFPWRQGDGI